MQRGFMLRQLYPNDLQQVLSIEQAVHAVPWNEETFKTCFNANYRGWVIENEKKIIAFIISSIRIEECHILNLCVAREYQHQGWGQLLLSHTLQYAKQKGTGIAYLEVRQSNAKAISLYRKMEFHLIGERKNYYPAIAGKENALIFAKSLLDEVS